MAVNNEADCNANQEWSHSSQRLVTRIVARYMTDLYSYIT